MRLPLVYDVFKGFEDDLMYCRMCHFLRVIDCMYKYIHENILKFCATNNAQDGSLPTNRFLR